MRAAVYIRMSTDDQESSPERQWSLIQAHCEHKGYRIIERYQDLGQRGWDEARPDFQRLLKDAQSGRFDIIIVDEMSRLSRLNTMEYIVKVAYPLQQAGVLVESVADGRHVGDELGELIQLVIRQDKASQESVTLGRRTATGSLKKAKDGKIFVGYAPYGYKYQKDDDGNRIGYILGEPEHVRIVRRIFDACVNRDLSLCAIVNELRTLGLPSPREEQWGKTTVRNILRNHVYAGDYVWGKVPQGRYFRCTADSVNPTGPDKSAHRRPRSEWLILPNTHEAIIDRVTFERAQALLTSNQTRTSSSRKLAKYPLAQMLTCAHCGGTMYGTKVSGKPGYRCGTYMSDLSCAPRTVMEFVLMRRLVEVLREKVLEPETLARVRAEMQRLQQEAGDTEVNQQDGLVRKLKKLDAQIEKAEENLLEIDRENLRKAQDRLRSMKDERHTIQKEILRLKASRPQASRLEDLAERVERLAEIMEQGQPEQVRVLIRETIAGVELRFDSVPKKKVTRYPWAGGVVHLVDGSANSECADSVRSGQARVR